MTQTAPKHKDAAALRLAALRSELERLELTGFVIPHSDEYQNEFLPPYAERLAWLTGFTGSAGHAIVLKDKAAMFTDSRYTIQVRDQVDGALYEFVDVMEDPGPGFLGQNLSKGDRLGYDPKLHTVMGAKRLRAACEAAKAELVPVDANPLDAVWTDQPAPPKAPAVPHPIDYAGEESEAKRARLAARLTDQGLDAAVITLTDSIAWLFNIRGGDVSHSPLVLSSALLHADGHAELFIDPDKASPELDAHLGNQVTRSDESVLPKAIKELKKKTVLLDPAASSDWVRMRLEKAGAEIRLGDDPVQWPKAIKNAIEVEGMRRAHLRDGAVLTRFLRWVKTRAVLEGANELSAATRLSSMRAETGLLKDLSFDVISAAGPNAALPHYRVTEKSRRPLASGEIYLVDSGGQYLDGTTDVTRTVILGDPTPEMKDRFTRVLKGHIGIAMARFPRGTSGARIDVLARSALWAAGLDYGHGTGHGVGAYLGVHEGPCGISSRAVTPLEPGMIVSNEPGYYKEGAYGIRIENLVVVSPPAEMGGDQPMLGFENLTFAPIDPDLIEAGLLTQDERAYLNAYHAETLAKIGPLLEDEEDRAWLEAQCAPV
mgnify:CR=1 FL=1